MRGFSLTSSLSSLSRTIAAGLILAVVIALSVMPLAAQVDSGSISGTVSDPSGAVVGGAKVTLTNEGTSATLSVTTGSDGRAATYRILGSSAGSQTATASSAGLDGSPVTFTSHAAPGSADKLVRVSGNSQSARPGAELSDPLVVRLVDSKGNGVPGRPVSWVIGAGGGHVSPPGSCGLTVVMAEVRPTARSCRPDRYPPTASGWVATASAIASSSDMPLGT